MLMMPKPSIQVREHELDEEKAEADANNSNALADELAERRRTLEQWSVAAYGEVQLPTLPEFPHISGKPPLRTSLEPAGGSCTTLCTEARLRGPVHA